MSTQTVSSPADRHAAAWRRIRSILARLSGDVALYEVEEALAMLRTELVALALGEDAPLRLVEDESRRALERSYDEVLADLDHLIAKVDAMNDGVSQPIGAELAGLEQGLGKLEDEGVELIRDLA